MDDHINDIKSHTIQGEHNEILRKTLSHTAQRVLENIDNSFQPCEVQALISDSSWVNIH